MVTPKALLEVVASHPDTRWPDIDKTRLSVALKNLGDEVAHHPNPADKRSKLLAVA